MSIQIIEGKRVNMTEYRLNYFVDKSGGYSFPCDEYGNIKFNELNDCSKERLEYCKNHPEEFMSPYVQKQEYSYKEPNVGTCNCGEKFQMVNEYLGACQCPECGQWYNLWGQELLPPDQWGEDY